MPEDIRISELSNVSSLGNNDLIEVSQVNAQSETGYDSKKATLINVGDRVCNGIEYANALYTSNKKIIGAINELTTYIPVWNNTASGSIATFDTSLALPLQDCTIEINAVQESGTPTPSSPKAISGFTGANIYLKGANLWDEDWENGVYSITTGESVTNANRIRSKNPIPVSPSTTYYFKGDTSLGNVNVFYYDKNGDYISYKNNVINTPFTTPANCYYIKWNNNINNITTYSNNVSVNYPATDTAYHAYNPNSKIILITWQSDAGTVYGGSLDVTSGVLTVDKASDTINNLTTNYHSTGSVNYLYSSIANKYSTAIDDTEHPLMFEMLEYGGSKYASQFTDLKCYQTTGLNIYLVDNSCSSKSDFITKYGTARLVWYLATPVTYQLTPTQISAIVGTNNVFTDTNGDTSVVYACSLKDYIDGQ